MSNELRSTNTLNLPGTLTVNIHHKLECDEIGSVFNAIHYDFNDANGFVLSGYMGLPSFDINFENLEFSVTTSRSDKGYLASDPTFKDILHCLISLGFKSLHYEEDNKLVSLDLNSVSNETNVLLRYNISKESLNEWKFQATQKSLEASR